jgi:hypothetical protein
VLLQFEIVELLKGLTTALSKHAQLEAPPHDTSASPVPDLDMSTDSGAAAYSHLKSLGDRLALVRLAYLEPKL